MTLGRHLRAAAAVTAIAIDLAFWTALLLVLLPAKATASTRPWYRRRAAGFYRAAVRFDNAVLRHVSGATWRTPELGLDPARPHIALANHSSWADIFIVQAAVSTDGPILVFLAKRELLYMPIVGQIILAFDFPTLRRRSKHTDDEDVRRADDRRRVRDASMALVQTPAVIISFAEGTRFTAGKRAGSNSPYQHLLPPRAGGLTAMIETLASRGGSIVDLTLAYPRRVSFWQFLGGEANAILVDAATIPIASVSVDRIEEWLNERWRRKDELIRTWRRSALADSNDCDLRGQNEDRSDLSGIE